MSTHCNLDLEDSKSVFVHDPPHDNVNRTKFGCKNVQRSEDIAWTKFGHTDTVIPITPSLHPTFNFVTGGVMKLNVYVACDTRTFP